MKLPNKLLIGLTLALTILLVTITLVNAQPQPIGTTTQTNPYESNPSAYTVSDNSGMGGDTTVMDGARMYDGRLTLFGFFLLNEWDYAGYVELVDFDVPTTTFTIGWVDIKMNYMVEPYAIDDTYRIEYSTDGTTWVVLQTDTTAQFDTVGPDAQTRSWSQVKEPNDGSWSWTDVGNLRVRISFDPGGDGFCDWNSIYVHEVWASVYKLPTPPKASTTVSIQPPVVNTLAAGRRFFVEVYAQDVTSLAGYQFTIDYNTTVISPMAGGWSYYPFTDEAIAELNDTAGYVSISYSIPISDPLVTTGASGNLTLARIYFRVDAGQDASDYSFLTFSVSLLGDPSANPIPHTVHHGCYGTPPAGTHLLAYVPTSELNWTDPVCSWWVEDCPEPGAEWHLTSWEDNEDGSLSASDQIDMLPEPPDGYKYWYHVESAAVVTPTGNPYMIVKFKYSEEVPEFPLGLGLLMVIALAVPIVYLWRTRKKEK